MSSDLHVFLMTEMHIFVKYIDKTSRFFCSEKYVSSHKYVY